MKRATDADRQIVVEILTQTFAHDPYILWLLHTSKRPDGVRILMEYVVDEALTRGEVWLSDNDEATALWHPDTAELLSFRFLLRNLRILFKLGYGSISHILRSEAAVHKLAESCSPFLHLYLIGVRSEHRGKGLASALMDPILKRSSDAGIPVVLETANATNVRIYEKKGFTAIGTLEQGDITVTVMKRSPEGDRRNRHE